MAILILDQVVKRYGKVTAVHGVSLSMADAEFVALLGPSGCGKTSTMRMIAGLESISDGEIRIGADVVNHRSSAERQIAMSFEHYGLYPHMSLFGNIAYPLTVRGVEPREARRRVVDMARLLDIEASLTRLPREVSSGVQQRVSLARALVRSPSIFLLDEPLSHLDADMRSHMRAELKRLQKLNGSTMLYVTHDQLEAMTMADRIAIMNQGRLQQVATPREIYHRPANCFVATFIGEPPMNTIDARVLGGAEGLTLETTRGEFLLHIENLGASELSPQLASERLTVGVRPTDLAVAAPGETGLSAQVRFCEFRGDDMLVTFDAAGTRLRAIMGRHCAPAAGTHVLLRLRRDRLHFFSADTGHAIGHSADWTETETAPSPIVP